MPNFKVISFPSICVLQEVLCLIFGSCPDTLTDKKQHFSPCLGKFVHAMVSGSENGFLYLSDGGLS
jgi:hypothetical protein